MVSPRRSSRARSTANPAPVSHSSSSSGSSTSNRGRLQKHLENESHPEIETTYSRRGDHPEPAFESLPEAPTETNGNGEEEVDETSQEDEITRCICGHQEYQGSDDEQADSADGLFIQCDQCHVWQHGFCVGITDQASTPENYYCERCKPELHKLGHSKSGMRTSLYLPTQSEPTSPINSKEQPHKRRTTMNSRDAEYDDALLKKVLEESKHDKASGSSTRGTSSRGRKRGTSEGSDEPKQDSKRMRTSDSPDSPTNGPVSSGDEKHGKTAAAPCSTKKSRGAAARNSTTTGSSVTGKRTSTRNRGGEKNKEARKEDSEHSDEYPPPRSNNRNLQKPSIEEAINPPPPIEAVPDTPQQPAKRGGRNGQTNGGTSRRRGAYRHRQSEDPNDASITSPHVMTRDHSSTGGGQVQKADPSTTILDKPTKPRIPQARMSINEMKRRVNGISDFITRTQIEMANSRQSDIYAYLSWMEEKGTPVSNLSTPQDTSKAVTPTSGTAPDDKDLPQIQINGNNGTVKVLEKATEMLVGDMQPGALEMMEMLSSKINRWQQHYGEKI
ncbi:hypothetical protein DFP73DRAFT_478906 [Morchella snyderi]|nr:hypothetical protein DFP73DRAFT_478906 [Morchella snyderi]